MDSPIKAFGKTENDPLLVQVSSLRHFFPFSVPVRYTTMLSTGGFPASYRTFRVELVDALYERLFPSYAPLLFICAPPTSGKTALCTLLHNRNVECQPQALVATIRANHIPPNSTLAQYFAAHHGVLFQRFCDDTRDRVALIDSAQMSNFDAAFWHNYVQKTIETPQVYPRLRFVIFATYDRGLPIAMPHSETFGLDSAPGLRLERHELDEMTAGMADRRIAEWIWTMFSGHIGIARFRTDRLGNLESVEAGEHLTITRDLLQYMCDHIRVIPTAEGWYRVVRNFELTDEQATRMTAIMNAVAAGKAIVADRTDKVMQLFVTSWLLYEDLASQERRFASEMLMRVWKFTKYGII